LLQLESDVVSESFDENVLQTLHNLAVALLADTAPRVEALGHITAALRIFLRMSAPPRIDCTS
jgi:hypothetical protein